MNEAKKNELLNQRSAYVQMLEDLNSSKRSDFKDIKYGEIYEKIIDFNTEIENGRIYNDSIWTSNATYDIYDEIEPIDINEYME